MQSNVKPRRRHSEDFKQQVIAACGVPGASVAEVARSFDLNDNLVHQWRRGRGRPVRATDGAVPVALAPAASTEGILIDVKRGPLNISVTWPVAAAPQLAAWMRELLR
jgi:transposase